MTHTFHKYCTLNSVRDSGNQRSMVHQPNEADRAAGCAVRTGGERHQSANHWPAVTRPGWDAQVVTTCLPLSPICGRRAYGPRESPRRGPQLFGGECAGPKALQSGPQWCDILAV